MIPKKKLLVLIPFIPYPLNTGGNQGSFHMLNYVKEYFDVHIWFHINNENKTRPLLDEFSKVLNNQVKIHFTSNKIGRNFITARAIKRKTDNIFLKNDVQYLHNRKLWGEGASGFADLQALEDINNIIVREKIELVQVEFSMLIDVIYALPKAVKTIFVHHEIGFARKRTLMSQLEYLYTYDWYWYEKSKAEEITALNRYDVVITLSDVDKEKLKKEGVVTEVVTSPLFIPHPSYPDFISAKSRLTYVASGRHYPNVEGLEWFIQNIHPLLVERMPTYQLDICGPDWDQISFKFKIPSNIRFMGFVESLPTIVPGSVMIVPILSGSGMRMKILEAINNTVPFVSTTIGAEGLLFESGRDCLISDEPKTFAESILNIWDNENIQRKFVHNARQVYEKYYSSEVQAKKRLEIIQRTFRKKKT